MNIFNAKCKTPKYDEPTIQMNNDFTSDNNTHFESGYVIPK